MMITGWSRWQSYRSDRGTPPWIKVHRNLMSNPDWALLSDAEKGQLVSMWIVAADKAGELPDNPTLVKKICQLDEEPNLRRFKDLGFIDAKLTHKRRTHDAPETETETETEKPLIVFDAKKSFEEIWKQYPNNDGKKAALKHFSSSVKTEEDFQVISAALVNYLASEKVKKGFIKNGSTWFNNWQDWIVTYCPVDNKDITGGDLDWRP